MRKSLRSTRRAPEPLATWRHTRQAGDVDMRATLDHRRGRVEIAERHGRVWRATRSVPADARTIATFRRQGRR